MRSGIKVIAVTFIVLTVTGVFSTVGAYFYFSRTALPLALEYQAEGIKIGDTWTISFGREVALVETPKLVPRLEGIWYQKRGLLGISALSFKPTQSFTKGVSYVADIPLARAYDTREMISLPRITFMTEPLSEKEVTTTVFASSTSPIPEPVKAITTGTPSVPVRAKLTPKPPEVFTLNVPAFKQEYSRSCEASSLRMVLAYYGITTDDMEILRRIGYAPRPKDKENNVWDDPHEMFVGDASKDNGEGYGVYGEPVVKAAESFGRIAEYTTTITPEYLAQHVREGHPIILWGYISSAGPEVRWNTPSGGEAIAIADEHARVVVGVQGSTKDPLGFYLNDPRSGARYEYWSTAKLIAHISAVPGVTNQAVVVK